MKRMISFLFLFVSTILFAQSEIAWIQQGRSGIKYELAFSPDGKYIVSANGESGTLWIIETETGKISKILSEPNSDWWSVSFSPDTKYIAAGANTAPSQLVLWEVSTGEIVRQLQPGGSVYSVAFSPDGKYMADGNLASKVNLWDVSTGQLLKTLEHDSWVYSLAFSPDGQYIASGSVDNTVKLWNVSNGELIRNINAQSVAQGANAVTFSPDGDLIASGGGDNLIRLWETQTGKLLRVFSGHTGEVRSVSFSPDGKYLVSGSDDFTVKLWEVTTGNLIRTFVGHRDWVKAVFSPDGKYIVSGGGRIGFYETEIDHTIKLWDVESGNLVWDTGYEFKGHDASVFSVAFSPDAKYIVSGGYDQTIKLWEAETGNLISSTVPGHSGEVYSISFSPDSKYIASASNISSQTVSKYTIKLWNENTLELIRTFTGHTLDVRSIAFSPEGKYIASASEDETIKLWQVETGELIKTFPFNQAVYSLAFSPSGEYIAYGTTYQGSIGILQVNTGKITEFGKGGIFPSVAFSPNGKYVVSGDASSSIQIWEISTGNSNHLTTISNGRIKSIAFSPDARYLSVAIDDGTVEVWDISTKNVVHIYHHPVSQNAVAWSPNEKYITSGTSDGSIILWNTGIITSVWQADITIKDNGNISQSLSFGQSPIGSDSIDTQLGEAPLLPTAFGFDASFHLPTGDESWKDYRSSNLDTVEWLIKFQPGNGGYPITFSWDNTKLPKGRFYLKDIITGTIVNVDMKKDSSYTLTNTGINELSIDYIDTVNVPTAIKVVKELPTVFSLSQNYPNPFNPITVIRYGLPGVSNVKIEIYNLLGQLVESLVNGTESAGYHEVTWNASSKASGIYLYTIEAVSADGKGIFRSVKKLLLLK